MKILSCITSVSKFSSRILQAVDLSTLLKQQITITDGHSLPYFIFITSLGLPASHEGVFINTISSLLSDFGDGDYGTTSLLIAARQPADRYMPHLTSLLHRSAGRHKINAFDLSESLESSVMQSGDVLYNDLLKRVSLLITNFINSVDEDRKPLIFLDDLAVLTDLRVPSNRFLGFLLVSNLHCLVIGYHGSLDGANDDLLFHLAHRRAELCLDVTPLDTGYSNAIDGLVGCYFILPLQLTISQAKREDSLDELTKTTKLHFRAIDRRIQCYYPGSSNLVS
ncbi:unnamed protein product [Hydatigera taeniaeformis]|uniref:Elongator complex protein 6 n=1 Tax=Hydatigena taeniaeformis TaxID=6205 RepID=A0A0R3XA96_HYDTA|nr:unnamed protein product [Hydatigera taeniaeformis]